MEWITKSLSSLGSSTPPLPFTIGDLLSPATSSFIWAIYTGIKKDDKVAVTVFTFDPSKQRDKIGLARNFLKRYRSIKHPLLPKYIDGVETEHQIIFATEYLKPLAIQLEKNIDNDFICLGLYKIASIIKFFNVDCGLVHANLKIGSIFTTKSGEWKLLGFEVLTNAKDDNNNAITQFASLLPDSMKYAPPEIRNSSWSAVGKYPVGAIDSWAFGCLIHEIFNGPFSRTEELGQCGKIPPNLCQEYKQFLNPNPSARNTQIPALLNRDQGYFDNEIIKLSNFLEQWSLKEAIEKDRFIQKISTTLDSFPIEFQKYKILPELMSALEFGGASPKSLTPILKIGSRLDTTEFEALISPVIIKLFALPDRTVRITLCENLNQIIEHLSKKVVSDKIFPNLANGFTDPSAPVREHTLKAILVIIPKLNDSIVNNDLLRYLATLQTDEEPGIRTNTTICIGKISKHLTQSTKKKVLIPAFSRSLVDPFPPSRNAGLLAYAATIESYDAAELTQRIIPSISPLLADPEGSIRRQASKNIQASLKRVDKLVEIMPETMEVDPSTPSKATASAPVGSSYMGWAMSAVSNKITGTMSSGVAVAKSPTIEAASIENRGLPPTIEMRSSYSRDTSSNTSSPTPITSSLLTMKVSSVSGWGGEAGWGETWDEEEPVVQDTLVGSAGSKGSMEIRSSRELWATNAAQKVVADDWGGGGWDES